MFADAARLHIAIQKSGRLSELSRALLRDAGLRVQNGKNELTARVENFPADLMFVRDDDIPTFVADGVCELGIVGGNVLREFELGEAESRFEVVAELGFGRCTLKLAAPENMFWDGIASLEGTRIATAYPRIVQKFLEELLHDTRIGRRDARAFERRDAIPEHILGRREFQRAASEAELCHHLEARFRLAQLEFAQDIAAHDAKLADAVGDKGRDVVVPDEHEVGREVLDPGRQFVLAILHAQAGIAQERATELGKPARLLDGDVEACRVSEHRGPAACRARDDSRGEAPASGNGRPGRSSSC